MEKSLITNIEESNNPYIRYEMVYSGDLLEKSITKWRKIYLSEKNKQNKLGKNKRFSSKTVNKVNDCIQEIDHYLLHVYRPFFYKLDPNDEIYMRTHRMIIYGMLKYSRSLKTVVMKASGYNLGKLLVEKGVVKTLDDLPKVFVMQRIGLLDIVDESLNTMRINIYECMSCFRMKPIGMSMCDFEAGVIEGVLEKLYGKNTTIEKYCWGLGYSFCGFEAYFE